MRKKVLFILSLCLPILIAQTGNAQHDAGKLPEVLPPSPQSFAMTKYGGINVGLNTGTPMLEVPIYNIETKNIKYPIQLTYASNGIRVDEIATRTGMTWVLNGSGVITRNVKDDPDEKSNKLNIPNDFTQLNNELLNYLSTASNANNDGWDVAPDFFSYNFNGNRGRFILNGSNVVQLQKTTIKIESLSNGSIFKITEPNGTAYYFGGSNATESSKNNSIGTESCAKNYNDFVTTAWYLTKIKHPNGDSIEFTYKPCTVYNYAIGITQTLTRKVNIGSPCFTQCPEVPSSECKSLATINSIYLSQIKTSNNLQMRFTYTGRRDLPYDYLQDSILIYLPDDLNKPFKSFKFQYTYAKAPIANVYSFQDSTLLLRPFLTKVSEWDKLKLNELVHSFDYNDINGVAARLSYSQDHFGYFNGSGNQSLLPPVEGQYRNLFPDAAANREPDPSLTAKGMLSKITYPTGGYDSLLYTGATVYTEKQSPPKPLVTSAATVGSGFSTPITAYSDTIYIENSQDGMVGASYYFSGNPEDEDFHAQSMVSFIRLSDGAELFYDTMNKDNPTVTSGVSLDAKSKYILKITSYGQYSNGQILLHYTRPDTSIIRTNKLTGGVVLDKVYTRDPIAGKATVKKFYYASLADFTRSSGYYLFAPKYLAPFKVGVDCGIQCTGVCQYMQLSSSSLINLYNFSGSNISYNSVIESFGENFENGGIEHRFEVSPDSPGEIKVGSEILGATLTNSGYMNGKETLQHYFIKRNNSFISVKKEETKYNEDSRLFELYSGYTVAKRYDSKCMSTPPSYDEFIAFDVMRNYIYCKRIYIESFTNTVFDNNGMNGISTTQTFSYDNLSHLLPTKIESINSRNERIIKVKKYPLDIDRSKLPASNAAAVNELIGKNINDPVLMEEDYNGTELLSSKNIYFRNWGNNIVAPEKIFILRQGILEERFSYLKYDSSGNIQEQAKSLDTHDVYLWGYNNQYPVAKITGSDYNTVKNFVNQNILNNPGSDQQLRDEIAKIRSGLVSPGTSVITYTFRPSIGITSETDSKGKVTYYEYDDFGRLKLIRDNDKKILRQYSYQYKQPITQ